MSGDVGLDAVRERVAALAAQCAAAVLAGSPTVTINVTGKPPVGFPRGELLSIATDGTRNYALNPIKVLNYLRDFVALHLNQKSET